MGDPEMQELSLSSGALGRRTDPVRVALPPVLGGTRGRIQPDGEPVALEVDRLRAVENQHPVRLDFVQGFPETPPERAGRAGQEVVISREHRHGLALKSCQDLGGRTDLTLGDCQTVKQIPGNDEQPAALPIRLLDQAFEGLEPGRGQSLLQFRVACKAHAQVEI